MACVYFVCPDFSFPSAGVRRLYRYAHRLRRRGLDSAIVHVKRGFRTDWHGYDVPVLWLQDQPLLRAEDVLVLPETSPELLEQTREFRGERVVIALSWTYAMQSLPPGKLWSDYGIRRAMAGCPAIGRWLEWGMGLEEVIVMDGWIDSARYYCESTEKEERIAYLARKMPYAGFIESALAHLGAPCSEYRWHGLLDLNEVDYAAALRKARVFLATGTGEGFPHAPLEAMACGCLVVGFHGIGGADFMIGEGSNRNCVLVENGNFPLLGQVLEETLRGLHGAPQRYEALLANGRATAARFADPDAEADRLETWFRKLLGAAQPGTQTP